MKGNTMKKYHMRLAAFAAISLVLTACSASGGGTETSEASAATDLDAETQALVDEALEAGSVTLYGMVEESALREVAADFESKYGITVEPVRLVSAELTQRSEEHTSELQSSGHLVCRL